MLKPRYCRMINKLFRHSSTKKRRVTLEDKSVYLCQKSVITMKNQVWPISSPKEKIWLQPERLQRYRRLPLEHAKLRQIFKNKSEGVLFPKWFGKWYVAKSLCERLWGKINHDLFSIHNHMNPSPGKQYIPYKVQQCRQYPPGWIYPGFPGPYCTV